MTASNNHEFSETLSIRMTKRDKDLLEKIRRGRGEESSRALGKSTLHYVRKNARNSKLFKIYKPVMKRLM